MNPPRRLWLVVLLGLGSVALSQLSAIDLPPECLERLKAEEFRTRETAERDLLAWSRARHEVAVPELLRQAHEAADPEVRARCLAVLRVLVADEYERDGEGYIGVQMLNEFAKVPGEERPRSAIRVAEVLAGTPGAEAGLKVNDLIVGLNGQVWHEGPLAIAFGRKVREFKPHDTVTLQLLREGKVVDLPLKLGRRPAHADLPSLGLTEAERQAAEQAAKDAHFRRWLEQRRPAK